MTGTLERRAAMAKLVEGRDDDLLVVPGLGSTTYDLAAAGDNDRNFYLWGAMGGAAMIGLGLALAQPAKTVAVITGDGEMLMGLGALATIGVQQPKNLAVIVFDNGMYLETGGQPSHTGGAGVARGAGGAGGTGGADGAGGIDMVAVARSCGFGTCLDVADEAGLADLASRLKRLDGLLFARVAIRPDEPPRVLPEKEGAVLKRRFRAALGLTP